MTAPETKKMALKHDPRFVRPKKKDTKLKVDSRFKGMFESEEFVAPVKVDKYGRKIVDKSQGEDLKRFYDLEEEEKEDSMTEAESETSFVSEDEASSSSSDGSDVSEEEPEMLVFEETLAQHPLVNREVELGEATSRLALVNIDWDQIKAIDIMQMLQAFKPVTGVIESVKIYPSEFGKERMALEAIQGPPKDIFKTAEDKESGSEEESEEEVEPLKPVMIDENEDFNEGQLRKYQLERLRYFYAVITCDSRETAAAIYKQCDGTEFEMSANFLDLRYIPEGVSFDADEPADSADRPNKSYKPKTDVITPALQHSKVKLTWDMDDPDRARFTKVNFANFDYKENDLKAYLASSSEDESDEDREADAAKYRELLLKGNANVFGRKSHEDNDELQVTFTTGFDGISSGSGDDDVHMEATFAASESEQESKKEDETLFEARLRRMRETKKAKKEARIVKIAETKVSEKAARLAAKQLSKKKRRLDSNLEDDKQAAELDLLMLDDAPDTMAGRHFDMSEILKKEKKNLKKGSKKSAKDVDEFKLDVEDDRFKAIYEEPAYSIDPTHSSFKKTSAMRSLIDERQRRLKSRHH